MDTIIDIVIKLIALVLIIFVIPKLREFLTGKIDEQALEQLILLIEKLVMAAEQEYKNIPKSGQLKKEYVVMRLEEMGVEITTEIDSLIEASVYDVLYPIIKEENTPIGPIYGGPDTEEE